MHPNRGVSSQLAAGRGRQQCGHRLGDERQQDLGLRIAETGVELEHPRTVGGKHQPDVEAAAERGVAAAHLGEHRCDHRAPCLVQELPEVKSDRRRVGTHAAGVGTGVAVEGALIVTSRAEHAAALAVGDGEDAHLTTLEPFLDQRYVTRLCEAALLHALAQCRLRVGDPVAHLDTLAERESVGLDHTSARAAPDEGPTLFETVGSHGHVAGRRDASLLHDRLGEAFAALEPRRRRRRTEARNTRRRRRHRRRRPRAQRPGRLRRGRHRAGGPRRRWQGRRRRRAGG